MEYSDEYIKKLKNFNSFKKIKNIKEIENLNDKEKKIIELLLKTNEMFNKEGFFIGLGQNNDETLPEVFIGDMEDNDLNCYYMPIMYHISCIVASEMGIGDVISDKDFLKILKN